MELFPTIHIKSGKCYSTTSKNILGKHNIFTSNPAKLAKIWEDAGAKRIHVVDVDGAMMGMPSNEDVVKEILNTVKIPIQFGGGLRSVKDIDYYLNMGVSRVVCGTTPVVKSKFAGEVVRLFGADKFVVGIDAVNGMVTIEGREKFSDFNAITLAHKLKALGVEHIVYTDLKRSTAHSGPNTDNIKELIRRTGMDITAAGGIYRMSDLDELAELNLEGVIIAAALYEGRIDLKEALERFS